MKKSILKIIMVMLGFFFWMVMLPKTSHVAASEETSQTPGIVQFIVSQKDLLAGEEVVLTINLSNVQKISEIDLRIKVDSNLLEPIVVNNRYFTFTALSIFENEDIINNYSDNVLWLKLTKTHQIEEDYQINSKNNIGIIKFRTVQKINNIISILQNEQILINLFDANRNLIETVNNFSEKISYNFELTDNEIEVHSEKMVFDDYFYVNNRTTNEYRLTITDNINYQKIGTYEIKICLYDMINEEIVNETIRVKVVDKEQPVITKYPLEPVIDVEDKIINELNLNAYFEFHDNYDSNLSLKFEYYTNNEVRLSSFEQFINYLKENKNAKFSCYVVDTSNNTSDILSYDINIIDTTPPLVNVTEEVEIKVNEEFKIEQYVNITDNYDPKPNMVVTYFYDDNTECFNPEDAIIKGKNLIIKIIAFDNNNNYSDEAIINLFVIDNISPEIIIKTLEIEDRFVNSFDYRNHFIIEDNVSTQFLVRFIFNFEKQVDNINGDTVINDYFREILKEQKSIIFQMSVQDEAQNAVLLENCQLKVIDLTPPKIVFKNIENGKKYKNLVSLDIDIIDNYSENIISEIYVNGELYNGYLDLKEGLNVIKVIATDEDNNQGEQSVNFYIEPTINNQKTEMEEKEPFINNIKMEAFLLLAIMIISLIIVLARTFFINYRPKHKIHK